MKVGVIGLGNMGMGAALNLLHKGHDVTGCELREETRAVFAAEGGSVVVSPDALPTDLDAVVVFVVNAVQTEQVLFGEKGCLGRIEKDAVVLCCATVAPEAREGIGPEARGGRLPDG
jgi:putative dehydrogenase